MRLKPSEFALYFTILTLLNIVIMTLVFYLCLDTVIELLTGTNVNVRPLQSIAVATFIIALRGGFMVKLDSGD
jgi:ABC-type glucose/galactose transport system permease subunit